MDRIDRLAQARRLGSACVLSGTILFAAATALHPPTVSPGDALESLLAALGPPWVLDHWALLAASILLLGGLITLSALLHAHGVSGFSPLASGCAAASLALWALVFAFEATGWPVLARKLGKETARRIGAAGPLLGGEISDLMAVAEAGWRTTLATGYVAALLLAVAVTLWGLDLASLDLFPSWFSRLALTAGLTTALAQPVAWSFPALALPMLIPGAVLLGGWFLAAGWFLWPRTPGSEGEPNEPGGAPSEGEG